jgi:hypothetical protein
MQTTPFYLAGRLCLAAALSFILALPARGEGGTIDRQ